MPSLQQQAAQSFIAARLAADPKLAANRLYQEAQAAGLGARRTVFLEEVREAKRAATGSARSRQPERHIPLKFRPRNPERDAAAILSLARREHGGRIEPARKEYNSLYPGRALSAAKLRSLAGPNIEKHGGRLYAKPTDRLPRYTSVFTTDGVLPLVIRDSRTASLIGRHWAAIGQYLDSGDEKFLRPFKGKKFRVGGHSYTLETDPDRILEDASTGQISGLEIGS